MSTQPLLPIHSPSFSSIPWHAKQIVFKNLRIMNGNSKMGFGGAVEVSGPVDLTFINCEFGGSISEWRWCCLGACLLRQQHGSGAAPLAHVHGGECRNAPELSLLLLHGCTRPPPLPQVAMAARWALCPRASSSSRTAPSTTTTANGAAEARVSAAWGPLRVGRRSCMVCEGSSTAQQTDGSVRQWSAGCLPWLLPSSAPSTAHLRPPPNRAVSTSAETWFVNCEFERNVVGNNGGAVLLEGGCPAGFFLNNWFKVRGVQRSEPGLEACLP